MNCAFSLEDTNRSGMEKNKALNKFLKKNLKFQNLIFSIFQTYDTVSVRHDQRPDSRKNDPILLWYHSIALINLIVVGQVTKLFRQNSKIQKLSFESDFGRKLIEYSILVQKGHKKKQNDQN